MNSYYATTVTIRAHDKEDEKTFYFMDDCIIEFMYSHIVIHEKVKSIDENGNEIIKEFQTSIPRKLEEFMRIQRKEIKEFL